ncbi:MAG TPA: hypothetical protein DCS73_12935 [Roseburia sp.]|nr:hypothetical protein [Roseburia sp.]
MNTYNAIVTRRSSRKYLDKPVEQELLEKVIEAGKYAPSGGIYELYKFYESNGTGT